MWLKNEHQIDATTLRSVCVLWINITGTLDGAWHVISTQMWSIDAFQIINAIFAILVLCFKGSATHGGTKLFVTGCKGLKKMRFFTSGCYKGAHKARGCLQQWRLRAIFVYKVAPQSSKTLVWTKWKEKRERKKKFCALPHPENYNGARQVVRLLFNRNDTGYKVTAWEGETAHPHTDLQSPFSSLSISVWYLEVWQYSMFLVVFGVVTFNHMPTVSH